LYRKNENAKNKKLISKTMANRYPFEGLFEKIKTLAYVFWAKRLVIEIR
jgi:hypothetical protein